MSRIKIFIKTLSPVVMSSMSNTTIMTETHSAFSGSIIRGVLASRYVENKKLGDKAFQNSDFREIFYDGLKFLPANPEVNDKRSIVIPQSLQAGKKGTDDEKDVQDLLTTTKILKGYKSLKGYGIIDGNKFYPVKVKKNIFMHMSRSGESERLAGKSIDGGIYNYESLDAGQNFQGEIIGDKKLLEKLIDGLKLNGKNFIANVGRSRFTQYGKCQVTFSEIEKTTPYSLTTFPCFLRLDTPLIPVTDIFISAEKVLQEEVINALNELCGKTFKLGKIFASSVEVENFVVTWGMKRPRVMALAAGTVFEISAENLTDEDKNKISAKIFEGFGIRTEEGFGQLRIWDSKNLTKEKFDEDSLNKQKLSDDTIKLAKKIFRNRYLEQIRIYAQEDADKLKLSENLTHFFTRLENILMQTDKSKVRADFKTQLELEMRDGSLFKDHLKDLRMSNGQNLFDVLTGKGELPYKDRDLNKNIPAELVKLLNMQDVDFDNEICLEYLQTYFRFARKKSSGGGKDE